MLSLFGRDNAIRNIYRLAKAADSASEFRTLASLRDGYINFLESFQRGIPVNRSEDVFVESEEFETELSAAFTHGSLNDLQQERIIAERYEESLRRAKVEQASKALMHALQCNDDFATVFGLAVHSIFVRPSRPVPGLQGSHGGSSSASIGAIWLTVGDSVTTEDLMEMFVHELTHHLLFIDELNHPQFYYGELAREENFAHSAILQKRRPLDKVIHSIVVATELVAARRMWLPTIESTIIHPPTSILVKETRASIASVRALPNLHELVTRHMEQIVDRCWDACMAFEGQ